VLGISQVKKIAERDGCFSSLHQKSESEVVQRNVMERLRLGWQCLGVGDPQGKHGRERLYKHMYWRLGGQ